jgi:competence protein ComEA
MSSDLDSKGEKALWWLRRADQAFLAAAALIAIGGLAGYWWWRGGASGRLVELDALPPSAARFEIDINSADWPEIALLPGIGETLARRIVASRQELGPYRTIDDLNRVHGIGPKTLARIRPYLRLGQPTHLQDGRQDLADGLE